LFEIGSSKSTFLPLFIFAVYNLLIVCRIFHIIAENTKEMSFGRGYEELPEGTVVRGTHAEGFYEYYSEGRGLPQGERG